MIDQFQNKPKKYAMNCALFVGTLCNAAHKRKTLFSSAQRNFIFCLHIYQTALLWELLRTQRTPFDEKKNKKKKQTNEDYVCVFLMF